LASRSQRKKNVSRAAPKAAFGNILKRAGAFWTGLLDRFTWWELTLLGFGGIAIVTIVVVLFLPFGKGPEVIRPTSSVPATGSPQFLTLLSNTMTLPVETGSRPVVLNNGDAFLKSLLADIDGAKSTIDFMVYIWDDGKLSDIVLDHLERRLKAGVEVRIALDAYGAVSAPSSKLRDFRKQGGKVATFHSLMPLPWAMARDHKRNHRRAIVIDGRIAYTGGIAVSDTWLGDARTPDEWRDLMFRVEGPMANHLQGAFGEVWELATGELLTGDKFYPPAASATAVKFIPFSSSPSPDLFAMENFVLLSLAGARKSIVIVSPYFLPDETLRGALEAKSRAGLDVRVLVPNWHNDNRWVRYASQDCYDELLRAGIKIYEYQPTFIHTKLMIVDGQWSVIGSANMDNRSRKLNDEVVFGIADPAFAATLTGIVTKDITKTQRINLAQWQKRGLLQRALELIALGSVQQY
jgi:cardiolipin synthase